MQPAPGRSCNVPWSQELAVAEGGMVGLPNTQMAASVPCCQPLGDDIMLQSPRGWLASLRVQQADHADGVDGTIVPAPGRSCNVPWSQELACCCKWHGRPAEHADGSLCAMLPAPRRYNVGISQGLASVPAVCSAGRPCRWCWLYHRASSWEIDHIISPGPRSWRVVASGMVGLPNTQMAACVPCCQPLGDIMSESPRGWLVFLRVQQADHTDGVDGTIVPAPGRSYNVQVAWSAC
ncbi:unnamed protein product [Penicillium camemberti]|uniref:Str. FM013 n=1 Tax=Penicillium camemberti (strain FM 013) TaxID=1429867 RepID=A0A0G4PIX7_PENC3|nr:unnamed protein product [Penicillium camemberti]